MQRVFSAIGFLLTLMVWRWLTTAPMGPRWRAVVTWILPLSLPPVVCLARKILDQKPVLPRAAWITAVVHFLILGTLGSAALEAWLFTPAATLFPTLLPKWAGTALMWLSGAVVVLTVLSLAVRGLGAPFAVALSRRLATDWLYARTRNPMILSLLIFFLVAGIVMDRPWFLLWVVAECAPAILFFAKHYEERELEIRFGAPYLEYRARTPMLWPRLRKVSPGGNQ